jgi:quercetin dioxygenase-like cupin family protein
MHIRNFLTTTGTPENTHGGEGLVKHVRLYADADFQTPLRFVIYSELPPGASIGYHTHADNEEVYVVLEGTGRMTINGETTIVKTGDVILNKFGWSHGLENNSPQPLKILVFEVDQSKTNA